MGSIQSGPHLNAHGASPRFCSAASNAQASAVLPLPEDGAASIHSIIRNSP